MIKNHIEKRIYEKTVHIKDDFLMAQIDVVSKFSLRKLEYWKIFGERIEKSSILDLPNHLVVK